MLLSLHFGESSGNVIRRSYDDLRKRMTRHKARLFEGFTKKYGIDRLMYFETYGDSEMAAQRERQIKRFRREKKIALFAGSNPKWKDLTPEIFQSIGIPRYARDFRKKSLDLMYGALLPGKSPNRRALLEHQ